MQALQNELQKKLHRIALDKCYRALYRAIHCQTTLETTTKHDESEWHHIQFFGWVEHR